MFETKDVGIVLILPITMTIVSIEETSSPIYQIMPAGRKEMKSLIFVMILMLCLIPFAKVYATNESSYLYGIESGESEYKKCDTTCLNLDALGLDCQTNQHVDNVTACNDGYAKIWAYKGHEEIATCILSGHTWDAGECQSGKLVAVTGPGHCYNNGTCESGEWTRLH